MSTSRDASPEENLSDIGVKEVPLDDEPRSDSPYRLHWHGEPDDTPLRDCLVENMIPKIGTGLLSGQWGTYKTFVAADLCGAVIAKVPFAGREINRQGGVLFIAVEGQSEVRIRFQAVVNEKIAGNLVEPENAALNIERLPFTWITACPKLSEPGAFATLAEIIRSAAEIMQRRFALPLVLVVIDTLSPAAQFKDADKSSETQSVMTGLKTLANTFEVFVLMVDHFGKDVSTGTRNSSVKESDVDIVIALLGERDLSGVVNNPRMALRKMRGGASGTIIPFTPRLVDVPDRAIEDVPQTLVIDFAEKPETAQAAQKKERWPKSLATFKRALDDALEKFGEEIRPFADGPQVLAVERGRVRDEFLASYPGDDRRTKSEAFRRCERDAVNRGIMANREIDGTQWFWSLT
jgi:hypothetical protein